MLHRVLILGSTGSIGVSTLDVIRDFPNQFQVAGLSAHGNTRLLADQAREFKPKAVCAASKEALDRAPDFAGQIGGAKLHAGQQGLLELVRETDADTVVVATVGFAGLFPTLEAIERGLRVCLANKEVLVVAGEIVMRKARERNVPILPIDSEHNAIFQCLAGNKVQDIRRLILTASGGPFRNYSAEKLQAVTPEQALAHPTWSMGPKITIDSATLMNKGFEMIEACHLFQVKPAQVDVVVHPQSTIHSLVEYRDGSMLAQLGVTNMYLPILNALAHPERHANKFPPLNLADMGRVDFTHPDRVKFPCLNYAYEAAETGGTQPAVLNAANEIAVAAFLAGRIPFTGIPGTIRAVLDQHTPTAHPDLETLREVDRWARETAEKHAAILR